MNIISKVQRFMYGRYGIDDLGKLCVRLYFIILLIDLFFNNAIITSIELLLFLITIFRILSKNIYRRNLENKRYLEIKTGFLKPFKNMLKNMKDKDHVYKKCHGCHVTLKLPVPKKRGIKHSTCPKCGKRNTFLILKQIKIEIIRK